MAWRAFPALIGAAVLAVGRPTKTFTTVPARIPAPCPNRHVIDLTCALNKFQQGAS